MSTAAEPAISETNLDLFPSQKAPAKKEKTKTTKPAPSIENKKQTKAGTPSTLTDKDYQFPSHLPLPNLDPNAVTILERRYLKKDDDGSVLEEPKDMFWRVARFLAENDKRYDSQADVLKTAENFYLLMSELRFMPNSPCLRGAGRRLQQMSGCFVLPIDDSIDGIFDTLKYTALIHKTGGGTGFDFSRLRPHGDTIGSTGNNAGGPVSFMKIYNATAGEITQGGVRMGANMGMLRVDHPDIEDFITAKSDNVSLTNFNISVSATDKFMEAIGKNEDHELINPRDKKVVRKINAREFFDKIVANAWQNGDPGMIFIDKINNSESNMTPALGQIESTNPCGEQPLLPYESCVLGSINLAKFAKAKDMDWKNLRQTVHDAVHFLDNIIDMNKYVIPEIERMTKGLRRIGMGVMGFADMLITLGIAYDSEEAVEWAQKVMKFINDEAKEASRKLAKKRGPFPWFEKSLYAEMGEPPIRNVARTTIAPTGTISTIASCSSGIEPIFALVHRRKSIWNKQGATADLLVVYEPFRKMAEELGFYSDELMEKISQTGSLHNIKEVPEDIRHLFTIAHDITPEGHIRIQAAFQKYTNNAVSKTINFSNDATIEDVKKSYILAYQMGCKGITIYRDGSRSLQVLTVGDKKEKSTSASTEVTEEPTTPSAESVPQHIHPRKRPEIVNGTTYKVKTGYGNMYVTVNNDEAGEPFEVFAHIGKAGGFFAAKAEAICRLISLALRAGIDPQEIIENLKGIRGPSPVWSANGSMVLSLPDALGQTIDFHIHRHEQQLALNLSAAPAATTQTTLDTSLNQAVSSTRGSIADFGHAPVCPECGSTLELGEGCLKCPACGFSKCG